MPSPLPVTANPRRYNATGLHIGIVNKYWSSSVNGFQLFVSGGNLNAWYYTPTTHAAVSTSKSLHDDTWHHVVAVFDDDGTEVFYDGLSAGHADWTAGVGSHDVDASAGDWDVPRQ